MADPTSKDNNGAAAQTNQNGKSAEQQLKDAEQRAKDAEAKAEAAEKASKEANEKIKTAETKSELAKLSGKYPAAAEHEADILEKVKSGYGVEDAVLAVLNKAGKLGERTVDRSAAVAAAAGGGSAATSRTDGSSGSLEKKDPEKMTPAELREAMTLAESTGQIKLT